MSRYGWISLSLMNCQMMRVISSPSSSTTVPSTLILAIAPGAPLPESLVFESVNSTSVLAAFGRRVAAITWIGWYARLGKLSQSIFEGAHMATGPTHAMSGLLAWSAVTALATGHAIGQLSPRAWVVGAVLSTGAALLPD